MVKSSKVLIIGATGYLGRKLVKISIGLNYQTFILYRPENAFCLEKCQMLMEFKMQGALLLQAGDQVLQQLKPIEAIKEAGTIKEYSLLAWLSSSLSFPLEIMLTSMAKVFGWLNKMLQCIQ